ncbi:MAG: hypothetical protein KDD77_13150, partial [Caldilineaceae bacterium]|nr:hypothetical protein [Caldilineaceae bacterium]
FGKFFHIFQRPAQLGVAFYRDVGCLGEQARCTRCGDEYASKMHIEDLITVERELGYRYDLAADPAQHYQRVCPRCRRAMLAIAQGRLWDQYRGHGDLGESGIADVASLLGGDKEQ